VKQPGNSMQREPETLATGTAARRPDRRVVMSPRQDDSPIAAVPRGAARSQANTSAAPQRQSRRELARRSRRVVRQLREAEREITNRESAPEREMRRSIRRRRDLETAEERTQRLVPRRERRVEPRIVRDAPLRRRSRSTRREAGLPPLLTPSPAASTRNRTGASQTRPEAGLPPM
jgi:hypothetical protein